MILFGQKNKLKKFAKSDYIIIFAIKIKVFNQLPAQALRVPMGLRLKIVL